MTVLIGKDEFYAIQSEKFVEETFEGSLPAFIAAFGSRKKPSETGYTVEKERSDRL